MSKSAVTRRILLFEGIGFCLVLTSLWLNEVLDLPRLLFGAPATPVNWRESLLESALVLALGAGTVSWTRRALARIKYLEGFLRICMHCKRIDVDGKWVPVEAFILDHSEAIPSHGVCPDCKRTYYAKVME